LRHQIIPKGLFQGVSREKIRSVEIQLCEKCGNPFAPLPQLNKIAGTIGDDNIHVCPHCKEEEYAKAIYTRTAAKEVVSDKKASA
jgi:hypothetical protein